MAHLFLDNDLHLAAIVRKWANQLTDIRWGEWAPRSMDQGWIGDGFSYLLAGFCQ